MSLLSSAIANRQLVLFCARLLVNCVMGWWSIPQTSMDELLCFGAADSARSRSIATSERQPIAPGYDSTSAGLRQTARQRPLC